MGEKTKNSTAVWPDTVEGVVVRGQQRGRGLGFPTANVATSDSTTIPPDGVYAGRFLVDGRSLAAAISVGTNPTFAGQSRTVEAYVLDVDEDFYDRQVGVQFVVWLRGVVRFDGVDALVEQVHRDVALVRELLPGDVR